jgi:large repetitive protein
MSADRQGEPLWPRALLPLALAALGALALLLALSPPAAAGSPPSAYVFRPLNNTNFDGCVPIEFNASFSSDPDGGPLYYIWQFPNETIEGPLALALYYTNFTAPGDYNVTLTVRDNESLEANKTVHLTIGACNMPPVAAIAAPPDGTHFFSSEAINFSASGSLDPDGYIYAYNWSANALYKGSGFNWSGRLDPGIQNITLLVIDNKGAQATASITLFIEVDEPPELTQGSVAPLAGFENDSFTFRLTYRDVNGEPAREVFAVVDGTPHAMALASGSDPRAGQAYAFALPLGAGRHAFYFLANDGNLTNLSSTTSGPDVFENASLISEDALAVLHLGVLPPSNLSLAVWRGALAPDPAGLTAVSPGYRIEGTALALTNFTLTLAFTPDARVNASTAHILREEAGAWILLVTATDGAAHTAAVSGTPLDLPVTFRVYASRASAPPNAPPVPRISYTGQFFPNETVSFDGSGSADPENATVLLAWHFEGPGLNTDWLPGSRVALSFPQPGTYLVTLRADDGAGAPSLKNTTLEIRERPVVPVNALEEPLTLLALAAAVGLSAVLALWWRARRPARKKSYDDQYGRLYTSRMIEEKEYNQLFEKFAEPLGADAAPHVPEGDPAVER